MQEGIRRAECKGKPPTIAAKQDNPDDRANQQANDGHGKAGAPKAPTKGMHGIEIASVNEDNLDDNKIASVGTKPWRPLLSGAKSAHDAETAVRGCARTTMSQQWHDWPSESRGACPTTKRGPHSSASQVPRL